MSLLSICAIVLSILISTVYIYFKRVFNYWKSRGIPHEPPTFPLGNISGFGKKYHSSGLTKRIYDQFKGQAKFCGVYVLTGRAALILDLELLKHILVKDFANFSDKGLYSNEQVDPLTGNLFFFDDEKWRNMRSKLTSSFTSGKMKFMFPTVVEVAERFKTHLTEVIARNDEVEIRDLLARFTTDVIGTCAFGIECNSLTDPNAEFKRMGEKAFVPKYVGPIIMAIHGLKKWSTRLKVKVFTDDVIEFFMNVVRETVEFREKNNISRNDFLDILLKLKRKSSTDGGLTFNEIASQIFLFFMAGFETSSTTLMYCLYEMAMNPEIQTKTRQIIQNAYKKHGELTYEMMMDIPYIDHVLHETLRKYPPVAMMNRIAKNDYKVPGTNDIIEKGTIVIIPTFAIQRDPEHYPNPDQFNPDRFENDEVQKRHSMAWLPFSEGPRNCIGLRFGMMQSRIGLITLLKNFEFSISPRTGHPLTFMPNMFILTPKGGVFLKLKKLQG